ncbi:MAG: hypothetical protein AAFR41_11470, partial [Pseudomonadota bacterium]
QAANRRDHTGDDDARRQDRGREAGNLTGVIAAVCGLVLDSLARARIEQKRLVYLSYPALGER